MTLKKSMLIALSVLISGFFIVAYFTGYSDNWVDLSNRLAVGLALKNHLIFGRDFISDYGPLGFLATRFTVGVQPFFLLLFDLFLLAGFTFVLYTIFMRTQLNVALRIIFVVLLVTFADIPLMLIWISLFLFFEWNKSGNNFLAAGFLAIAILSFYIRFSTGLLALFLLLCCLLAANRQGSVGYGRMCGALAICLLGIVVLGSILPIDLPGYIANGFSLLAGYSDAMHQQRRETSQIIDLMIGCACYVLLLLPALLYYRDIRAHKPTLYLYLIVLLAAFILFKTTFVRIENYHFFNLIILLAALVAFFAEVQQEKIFYYSLLPIILLVLLVTFKRENVTDRAWNLLRSGTTLPDYLSSASTSTADVYLTGSNRGMFSEQQKAETAGKTFDVMPGNITFLHKTELAYTPRPLPETFYAYTMRLDKMNADFISRHGPSLIMFDSKSTDDRYTLFDEPNTKVELLRNYKTRPHSDNGAGLVLERLENPVFAEINLLEEDVFDFNETIPVDQTDGLQLAYPKIRYSWTGRIFKFLFWPPDLSVTLTLNDNSTHTFKCLVSLVESGVIINKYAEPGDNKDYAQLIDYFGRLNRGVKLIQFTSGSSWAFRNKFSMKIETMEFGGSKKEMDARDKPIFISKSKSSKPAPNVRSNFEAITIDQGRIDVYGWAFVDDSTQKQLKPALVLEADDHYLAFPILNRIYRPDVKQQIGKNAGDSSGFETTVYRDFLDTAVYTVGLAFLKNNELVAKTLLNQSQVDNSGTSPTLGVPFREFTPGKNDHQGSITNRVERIEKTETTIALTGWAFLESRNSRSYDSMRLLLKSKDGKIYSAKTNPVARPDVSDYFKNPNLDSTGFQDVYVTSLMEKGVYEFGIYIRDRKTGEGTYQFFEAWSVGYPAQFDAKPFEGTTEGGDIQFGVDKVDATKGLLTISGWAFLPNSKTDESEIQILLRAEDNSLYYSPTVVVERHDVSLHFNKGNELDYCGFGAIIIKKKLKLEKYEIGINIRNRRTKENVSVFTGEYFEK